MQAVLFSKTGEFSGTSFKITGDVNIGKNNTNDIQLRSGVISGSHARITYDQDQQAFYLEDLGSSNGTYLDGIKIKAKEKLERLHVISFAGKHDFVFQVGGVAPLKTKPPESAKVKPAAPPQEKTVIEQGGPALPSFSKKEEPVVEKTVIESGAAAPAPLPSFGKKSEPAKLPAGDREKTVFESGKESPAPLPSFGKPRELPKAETKPEQPKTMFEKSADSALPQFAKKPEMRAPSSEEATEVMKPAVPLISVPPAAGQKTAALTKFVLRVEKLNKEFELNSGANSIGRVFGSDIIIEDTSLSRKHASIVVTGDKLTIVDLGSRNGTFVNKNKINSEVEITSNSVIKLGLVEMKIKKAN
jgi:pSer/pThr/pTyr-binding forkhead associated (FHA) protein